METAARHPALSKGSWSCPRPSARQRVIAEADSSENYMLVMDAKSLKINNYAFVFSKFKTAITKFNSGCRSNSSCHCMLMEQEFHFL